MFGKNHNVLVVHRTALYLVVKKSDRPSPFTRYHVNANFNLNIFQRLKLSTDNLSGMTDQVFLNLSLAQLARLGEAKEFESNMLKKQYLIKRGKS